MRTDGAIITNAGQELLSYALANNKQVNFTKVKLGKGDVNTFDEAKKLTDVVSFYKQIPITSIARNNAGIVRIRSSFTNADFPLQVVLKEIGVFAVVEGKSEVLFGYVNDGEGESFPPGSSGNIVERVRDIYVGVSTNTQVTAVVDRSVVYATIYDLDEEIAKCAKKITRVNPGNGIHGGGTLGEDITVSIKSNDTSINLDATNGITLKKTTSWLNDAAQLFTAKGALNLFNTLTTNFTDAINTAKEALRLDIVKKTDKGTYSGTSGDLKSEIDTKLNHTNGYGKNIGIDTFRKVIPNATLMNPQGDNSVLDTIAVHLPSGWNSSMLAFDLKVRAYNIQSANLTISFTGYPFGGNKAWHGVHVKVSGGTYEGKIRAFTTTHPSSGNPLIYFNFPNKFDYLNFGIFNVLESVATEYEIYAIQGAAGDEVPVVYEYSTTHKPDELRVSRNITIGNVTKQFNGGNDLNYTYEELRLLSKDKDEIMNGSLSINTILNVRDANGTHSMLMTAQGGITWLQGGATGLSQKMEITGLNASNLETLTLRANEVKFNGLLNMKSGSSIKYPNNMVQYSDEYAVGFMDATNGTWKIKANKNGGVDIYGNSSTTGVHTIYSDHNALTLTGRTGASPLYILARDSGGSHLWDIGKLNSVNDLYIENLVYGTQLVVGQNDIRTNKMILEGGQRVYSPNNKPTPQVLGCFPYNTLFNNGSIPKTFIGACQVSSNSPDYGDVGGGSQHFLIQMTTESVDESNAYVGQIGFGYNSTSPNIGIRAKTPSGDGAWHLVAMKREFSMVALNGYHKHIDASGKITLYFEITLAPNEVRTINFPEAFPNTCFSIVSCGKVNSASRGTSVTCGCVPINKYGFSAQGMYANSNLTYMIVAEGY